MTPPGRERRKPSSSKQSNGNNIMAMVGQYTSLAFLLPVATFVGYVLGYLLDKAFGTHYLYIPGLIFGIAAGFVQLIRQLMRDTRNDGS
jgi:F0F1-type ATP synthase assembly protein I